MTSEEGKQKQATLDITTIFNRLTGLESRVEKAEEAILKVEVLIDTVSAGQGLIYAALEGAGLMKDSEPVQPAAWNPKNIKWVQAEGSKGPYQRYPDQDQKAEATDDYKSLLADLKRHNGRMMRDGYFYWIFQDGATIGRKLKGKETKKATSHEIEAVKAKFSAELAELLTFTVEEQFVVLKPRKFLGSENFAKIAAVVRSSNGEYISQGKDSHFKILRKK